MGAFPYTRTCKDCKHTWSGYWFSHTLQTIAQGQSDMSTCPACGGTNVSDGKLEW